MVQNLCLFPGCGKPTFKFASTVDGVVACGNLHHFQLMCQRFCTIRPERDPELRGFYNFRGSSTCGLSSCDLPSSPGHSFCSKDHYLVWFNMFSSKCTPQQICRLSDCQRHVFVSSVADNEPGKLYDFCGWKHCQLHNMRIAALTSRPDETVASHQLAEPSMDHIMDAFKSYVRKNIRPSKYALVDEKFFFKHPWEILLPEQQSCVIFAKNVFKGKAGAKKRTTKDGYQWRPTGSERDCAGGVKMKYLTYKKRIRAADCSDEHENRCFSIREYTVDNLPDHCVVHLSRTQQKTSPEKPIRKKVKRIKNEMSLHNGAIYPSESDNNQSVIRLDDREDGDVSSFLSPQVGDDHNVTTILRHGDDCDIGRFCDMQDGMCSSGSLSVQNGDERQNRRTCGMEYGNGDNSSNSVLLQGTDSDGGDDCEGRNGSNSMPIHVADQNHAFACDDANGIETFVAVDTMASVHEGECFMHDNCLLFDCANMFSPVSQQMLESIDECLFPVGQQMLEPYDDCLHSDYQGDYGVELFQS